MPVQSDNTVNAVDVYTVRTQPGAVQKVQRSATAPRSLQMLIADAHCKCSLQMLIAEKIKATEGEWLCYVIRHGGGAMSQPVQESPIP